MTTSRRLKDKVEKDKVEELKNLKKKPQLWVLEVDVWVVYLQNSANMV